MPYYHAKCNQDNFKRKKLTPCLTASLLCGHTAYVETQAHQRLAFGLREATHFSTLFLLMQLLSFNNLVLSYNKLDTLTRSHFSWLTHSTKLQLLLVTSLAIQRVNSMRRTNLKGVNSESSASKTCKLCVTGSPCVCVCVCVCVHVCPSLFHQHLTLRIHLHVLRHLKCKISEKHSLGAT